MMDEQTREVIQRMTSCQEIPDHLVELYEKFKYSRDKVYGGVQLSADIVLLLCVVAGVPLSEKKESPAAKAPAKKEASTEEWESIPDSALIGVVE